MLKASKCNDMNSNSKSWFDTKEDIIEKRSKMTPVSYTSSSNITHNAPHPNFKKCTDYYASYSTDRTSNHCMYNQHHGNGQFVNCNDGARSMFRTCPTPQDALFLNLLIEKATLLHQSHIPLTLGSKVIDSEIPSHSHKEKQDAYSCKDHKGSSCCDLLEMCQNDIEEYLKLSQTIHSTSHIDSRTMYHLMETGVPDYLKHAQVIR